MSNRLRTRFYKELCKRDNIYKAWQKIHTKILSSDNKEMKGKANDFYSHEYERINSLIKKLQDHTFKFEAKATPIKKKNKKDERPVINLTSIEGRIVQKCLLDILQAQNSIKKFLDNEGSYGGVSGKNVAKAVQKIYYSMRDNGYVYAKATDISSFFTKIRKDIVLQQIKTFCKDDDFINLLNDAIDLEISNIDEIKNRDELYKQYIYSEEGVPQGSCLSPLFGNIYMYYIDKKMLAIPNVTYIRYIDDVLILGKTKKDVKYAFDFHLIPELCLLGLETSKAKTTLISNLQKSSIEYLGVDISINRIKPTKKSIDKFHAEIKQLLRDAINIKARKKKSLYNVLDLMDKKIKGWSCHYSFCHAKNELNAFDDAITKDIYQFFITYQEKLVQLSAEQIRIELGIRKTCDNIDSNKDIIAKYKNNSSNKLKQKDEDAKRNLAI